MASAPDHAIERQTASQERHELAAALDELAGHSSKCLGEYAALVVDPKRKVLHSVWTHTVEEGEPVIARLRYATPLGAAGKAPAARPPAR